MLCTSSKNLGIPAYIKLDTYRFAYRSHAFPNELRLTMGTDSVQLLCQGTNAPPAAYAHSSQSGPSIATAEPLKHQSTPVAESPSSAPLPAVSSIPSRVYAPTDWQTSVDEPRPRSSPAPCAIETLPSHTMPNTLSSSVPHLVGAPLATELPTTIEYRLFYPNYTIPATAKSKNFEILHYLPTGQIPNRLPRIITEDNGCPLVTANIYLQILKTAQDTYRPFDPVLSRLTSFQPLPIVVGHPQAKLDLPFYQRSPFKCIAVSEQEKLIHPDIISHEIGHAILDSVHEYDYTDLDTATAHEAFADCCAMVASWQEPEIIWDILAQRCLGSVSNKSTALGENWGVRQRNFPLRDCAQPDLVNPQTQDPHVLSQTFSHGFYKCLEQLENCLRQAISSPNNSAIKEAVSSVTLPHWLQGRINSCHLPITVADYQSLVLASQILTVHLSRSLLFLPATSTISVQNLSQALIKAAEEPELKANYPPTQTDIQPVAHLSVPNVLSNLGQPPASYPAQDMFSRLIQSTKETVVGIYTENLPLASL